MTDSSDWADLKALEIVGSAMTDKAMEACFLAPLRAKVAQALREAKRDGEAAESASWQRTAGLGQVKTP